MSEVHSPIQACADALMKAWFPTKHDDETWLNSPDGEQWQEIAILDARTVITAYKTYFDEKYAT